jgi:hypothetical protein
MDKKVTVTLPEGYHDAKHFVAVTYDPRNQQYAAVVIDAVGHEEIGEDGNIRALLADAASIIKKAVKG